MTLLNFELLKNVFLIILVLTFSIQ